MLFQLIILINLLVCAEAFVTSGKLIFGIIIPVIGIFIMVGMLITLIYQRVCSVSKMASRKADRVKSMIQRV